jgi:hypothetical protein
MPRRGESAYLLPDAFWSKVAVGSPDECWPWMGSTHSNGYGYLFTSAGSRTTAHRHALRLSGVDVAPDEVARHTCDNRACCNPRHLLRGTPADNMRDKVKHGNHWYVGEAQHDAKLTRERVAEIRALHAAGGVTQDALAQRYGVNQSTVSSVVRRQTWK